MSDLQASPHLILQLFFDKRTIDRFVFHEIFKETLMQVMSQDDIIFLYIYFFFFFFFFFFFIFTSALRSAILNASSAV